MTWVVSDVLSVVGKPVVYPAGIFYRSKHLEGNVILNLIPRPPPNPPNVILWKTLKWKVEGDINSAKFASSWNNDPIFPGVRFNVLQW